MPKNKKLALKLRIQTHQILTNDDKVCIPSLSSILLAVLGRFQALGLWAALKRSLPKVLCHQDPLHTQNLLELWS